MSPVTLHPRVTEAAASRPFVQEARLELGGKTVARGHWHSSGNCDDGVVQIIDVFVEPAHRRQGHGAQLLRRMLEEAEALHRARKRRLRRAWIAVEQKQQVIARAFLTAMGFHHVGTVKNLLREEDLLVYSKGFD